MNTVSKKEEFTKRGVKDMSKKSLKISAIVLLLIMIGSIICSLFYM